MSRASLLRLEIRRPRMNLFVHFDTRWGHVSISLRGQRMQCMYDTRVAKRCVFVGCPYVGCSRT